MKQFRAHRFFSGLDHGRWTFQLVGQNDSWCFPSFPPFSPLWFGPHPAGPLADLFVLLKLQQPIARRNLLHWCTIMGVSSTISVSFQTRAMPRDFQNFLTRFSLQPSLLRGRPLQKFVPSYRRPSSLLGLVRGLWPGPDFPVTSLSKTVPVSVPFCHLDGVSVTQNAMLS